MVNEVVIHGSARYRDESAFECWKEYPSIWDLLTFNRIRVVPRRELFVPDVDEEFFVFCVTCHCEVRSTRSNLCLTEEIASSG